MSDSQDRLGYKSATILQMIAQGHSYGQILRKHKDWSYSDISEAAEEAFRLINSQCGRLATVFCSYPLTGAVWTDADDRYLKQLFDYGKTIDDIACITKRHPNTIIERLQRLNLVNWSDEDTL